MTYRAPVADIAFTLKHSRGPRRRRSTSGLYGDLAEDIVEAVLEEAASSPTACSRR